MKSFDHEASIGCQGPTISSSVAPTLLHSVATIDPVTFRNSVTSLHSIPFLDPVTTLRPLKVSVVVAIVAAATGVLLVSMTAMSVVAMVVSAMRPGMLVMTSVRLACMSSVTARLSKRPISNSVVATFHAIPDAIEFARECVFTTCGRDESEEVELCVDGAAPSIETPIEATCLAQILSRVLVSDAACFVATVVTMSSIVPVMGDRGRRERERGGDQTAQDDSLVNVLSSVLRLHRIDLHACWVEYFVLLGRDLSDRDVFRPTGDLDVLLQGPSA